MCLPSLSLLPLCWAEGHPQGSPGHWKGPLPTLNMVQLPDPSKPLALSALFPHVWARRPLLARTLLMEACVSLFTPRLSEASHPRPSPLLTEFSLLLHRSLPAVTGASAFSMWTLARTSPPLFTSTPWFCHCVLLGLSGVCLPLHSARLPRSPALDCLLLEGTSQASFLYPGGRAEKVFKTALVAK